MCLTIPGKILSIDKGVATVLSGSKTAQIDLGIVFDAEVGNWVLYAGERAVKVITEQDAKEIISLLEDKYHPVDVAKLPLKFKKIIFKVRTGDSALTRDEIIYLLKLKGSDNLETLHAEANFLRKDKIEDFVCIHGIVEFSNYCKNNCLYCGIRRDSNKSRYRMASEEIYQIVESAVNIDNYKLIVLQSGEDEAIIDDEILELVKKIKKNLQVVVFLSVGERSLEFYKKAWRAGARGILIRFETANSELYSEMRPGLKIEDRLALIKEMKKIGYYIATGSLIGLPGQSLEDIADDLCLVKELGNPMISAGPYIGAKNTPLEMTKSKFQISDKISNNKIQNLSDASMIELTLKYIAVARFMMPEVKIPVTTALETLDSENGRHRGLLAGANALMFNLTPEKYAGDYSIYDNKYREREKIWQKYGLFKGEESWEMMEEKLKG
ncbi:MAG: radical SAM protein [bacterium]